MSVDESNSDGVEQSEGRRFVQYKNNPMPLDAAVFLHMYRTADGECERGVRLAQLGRGSYAPESLWQPEYL